MTEVKVHTGYVEQRSGEKTPTAWVETSLVLQPDLYDLMDGLGSKYLRYEVLEDDEQADDRPSALPETLTQRQILKIYREELLHWGTASLGLWADDAGPTRHKQVEAWLAELVVAAFPEMKEYIR